MCIAKLASANLLTEVSSLSIKARARPEADDFAKTCARLMTYSPPPKLLASVVAITAARSKRLLHAF